MFKFLGKKFIRPFMVLVCCLSTAGCVSSVVSAVVDTAVVVAKVPFKVAGAVKDVVTKNDDDDNEFTDAQMSENKRLFNSDIDDTALEMESSGVH